MIIFAENGLKVVIERDNVAPLYMQQAVLIFLQAFEPLYNQHLIPPSFPRELTIVEPSQIASYFTPVFAEMKQLLKERLISKHVYQSFFDL